MISQRFPKMPKEMMRKLYNTSYSTRYLTDIIITLQVFCYQKGMSLPDQETFEIVKKMKIAA